MRYLHILIDLRSKLIFFVIVEDKMHHHESYLNETKNMTSQLAYGHDKIQSTANSN